MLWAFDILPALDGEGKEIELDTDDYEEGFLVGPREYKVRFKVRGGKREGVIRREFEGARGFLRGWE